MKQPKIIKMRTCIFYFKYFQKTILKRNARQKLLEQQKQNFLEKQKMNLKNQNITTNANYKPNFDNLKGFLPAEKPELDYDKLSVLVPKNEIYYEPGKTNAVLFKKFIFSTN